MTNIPPEMTEGLLVNSLPEGMISIQLVTGGKIAGGQKLEPEMAMVVVAQILTAAKQSGKRATPRPGDPGNWVSIQPSSMALGPSQIPNHESIILRFGDVELGVSIPINTLRSIGQALIALTAAGKSN
jgi:hypothetical protein